MRLKESVFVVFLMLLPISLWACVCLYPPAIKNLSQLERFEFIAHVKITDANDDDDEWNEEGQGEVIFNVIELFKGDSLSSITEYGKFSSCDMGISDGQEWLLFGSRENGELSVGACEYSTMYKDHQGLRDWKNPQEINLLLTLKKLFDHPIKHYENETRIDYYSNGQKEIEETYVNGKLEGSRKIWYPDGTLMAQEYYVNGEYHGKQEWFQKNGLLAEESFYRWGEPYNYYRSYYDLSSPIYMPIINENGEYVGEYEVKVPKSKLLIRHEIIYGKEDDPGISTKYRPDGSIDHQKISYPGYISTIIHYHYNGRISSIHFEKDGKNYGRYQQFNLDGSPGNSWDYDEDGKKIK